MIEEIIGLPGVGKSTFSQKKGNQVVINNRAERFMYGILFMLSFPILANYFIIKTIKTNKFKKTIKNKLLFLLLMAFAKEQKAKAGEIIDEGLFQYILSLYETSVDKNSVQNDVNRLQILNRKVLHLTIPEEQRKINLQNRKRYYAGNLTETDLITFTQTMFKTQFYLQKALRNNKNYSLIKTEK